MTTIELVGSGTVGFSDGSGGHVYALPGGAPEVGELDILCVNSNTTVSTPAGFTAAPVRVAVQGAYVFRRQASGGESGSVTLTTSGDWPTTVTWSRWRNVGPADVAAHAGADLSVGTSSPAVSTGTLSTVNQLVLMYAALHDLAGTPSSPVWSSGYTPLETGAVVGAGTSTGVAAFSAYRVDAGTGSESPSVSWTGGASERYSLILTVTPLVSVGGVAGLIGVVGSVADVEPGSVAGIGLIGSPGSVDLCGSRGLVVPGSTTGVPRATGSATVRHLSGSAVVV